MLKIGKKLHWDTGSLDMLILKNNKNKGKNLPLFFCVKLQIIHKVVEMNMLFTTYLEIFEEKINT